MPGVDRSMYSTAVYSAHSRLARVAVGAAPLLALLLQSRPAAAQTVAFSSTSFNSGKLGTSWDHTVPAGGQGRYLLYGISVDWTGGSPTVMSAQYKGVDLVKLGSADDPGRSHIEIWGMANPPEGANLASVRLTANASFVAGAASFTGVTATGPIGALVSATGTSTRATLNLASVTGEQLFTVYASGTEPLSLDPEAPLQRHWFFAAGGGGSGPGGGSASIAWNASPSQGWLLAGLVLRPDLPTDGGTPPAPDAAPDTPPPGMDGSTTPDTGGPTTPDTGSTMPDTGGSTPDTGPAMPDGGSPIPDAGVDVDAPDAVTATDAGPDPVDGATARDSAGAPDVAISVRDIDVRVGCACRLGAPAPPAAAAPALVVLLGLVLTRRRRR